MGGGGRKRENICQQKLPIIIVMPNVFIIDKYLYFLKRSRERYRYYSSGYNIFM